MKRPARRAKKAAQGPSLHVLVSAKEHAETWADANTRGVTLSDHVRTVLGLWRAHLAKARAVGV